MMMQNLNGLLISRWPALVDTAVKGAAVLVLAWGVALLLRKSSAARRHLVWTAGLTGILLLPLFNSFMPRWQIRFAQPAPAHSSVVNVSHSPGDFELPLDIDLPGSGRVQPARAAHAESRAASPSLISRIAAQWRAVLAGIWLIGTAGLLARTLLGALSLARLARRSNPLADSGWQKLLADGREQLRINADVILLASDQRVMPMTWGILRPKILLPQSAAEWPADQRQVVLLHELAHIRRRDCLIHLLSQTARAMFWFNPLCWVAVQQMMLEREIACDDLVVSRGILASDYAEHLVNIAACFKLDRLFPTAAIAMARSGKLGARVRAVLDPARPRQIAGRRFGLSVFAGATLLLMPLTMLRPFAADAQQAGGDKPANAAGTALVLPPIPEHTQVLLHADFSKLTPDAVDAAAFTVFGKPYRDTGADHQMFGDFGEFHDIVTRDGASQVWMLDIMIPANGPPPYTPEVIVAIKDQAQADAITADLKKLRSHQNDDYLVDGQYLIIRRAVPPRDGALPAPAGPTPNDPATAAEFEKAMKLATAGDPVQLALVIDQTVVNASEAKPMDMPPLGQKFKQLIQACKSVTISAQPGNEPSLHLAVHGKDADGAKKAAELVNEILPDLLPEFAASQENDPRLNDLAANLSKALRDARATVVDDRAELSLNTEVLKNVGNTFGPFLAVAKTKAMRVQSMNAERQLALMITLYANEHDGKLPEKLDDVASYAGTDAAFKAVLRNANVPGVDVGYVYEKPADKLSDVKTPTPMIWEVNPKDGKKAESGVVGYSDGHVEFHAKK